MSFGFWDLPLPPPEGDIAVMSFPHLPGGNPGMIEGCGCPTGDFGHDRKIVGSFEFGVKDTEVLDLGIKTMHHAFCLTFMFEAIKC